MENAGAGSGNKPYIMPADGTCLTLLCETRADRKSSLSGRPGPCLKVGMSKYQALTSGLALGLLGLWASVVGCSGSVKNTAGCDYNGKAYAVGDTFPASDGCNQCSCGPHGELQCSARDCQP